MNAASHAGAGPRQPPRMQITPMPGEMACETAHCSAIAALAWRGEADYAGSMTTLAAEMLAAARRLCQEVDALRFGPPVTHVYNPLVYAWAAQAQYIERYAGTRKQVVLLGMNPGPFGMGQTGVPFGEVARVRDFLGIEAPVQRPAREHPARPVLGFACREFKPYRPIRTLQQANPSKMLGFFVFGNRESIANDKEWKCDREA